MTEPGGQGLPAVPPPEPPPVPERYPFWRWADVLMLLALVLPLLLVSQAVVTGVFWLAGWSPQSRAAAPVAATFLFYGLWFVILHQWIRVRYDRPFWLSMAWLPPPRGLRNAASWGIIVAFISIVLGIAVRTPVEETPLDRMLQDPISLVLVGFFSVTLGPVCEELAFRGFLMPLVIRAVGGPAGVILTALPFALLHGFEYAWSWQRLLIILFAGAAFGWMRWRSGSTAAAALMHSTYNLTFFATYLVAKQQ